MDIPVCCGEKMKINIETSRFIEVQCKKCGDIIYLKKDAGDQRPVMLDD
jgi:predicted nucleic-acid-binding Zn-ribbon protein